VHVTTKVSTSRRNHLQVYVRLRPPGDGSNAVDPRFLERFPDNPKKLVLRDAGHHYGEYAFLYDHVFWTDAKQEDVFNIVCRPQVGEPGLAACIPRR
jgi:hypothetical protein